MVPRKEPRTPQDAQALLHDYRHSLPAEHDRLSDLLWASFGDPGVHLEHLRLLEDALDRLKAHWAEAQAAQDPFEPRSYPTLGYQIANCSPRPSCVSPHDAASAACQDVRGDSDRDW
jgi:hypothetical protein